MCGAVCTGRLALINWSQPAGLLLAQAALSSGGSSSALAGGRGRPLGHERHPPPPGPGPGMVSSQAVSHHDSHHPHDTIRQKSSLL